MKGGRTYLSFPPRSHHLARSTCCHPPPPHVDRVVLVDTGTVVSHAPPQLSIVADFATVVVAGSAVDGGGGCLSPRMLVRVVVWVAKDVGGGCGGS